MDALEESIEEDSHLDTSQVGPGTAVDSDSEGKMPIALAVEVKSVGVRKVGFVTIGGEPDEGNGRSRRDTDPVEVHILKSLASREKSGAIEAEHFLDRRRDEGGVLLEGLYGFGV